MSHEKKNQNSGDRLVHQVKLNTLKKIIHVAKYRPTFGIGESGSSPNYFSSKSSFLPVHQMLVKYLSLCQSRKRYKRSTCPLTSPCSGLLWQAFGKGTTAGRLLPPSYPLSPLSLCCSGFQINLLYIYLYDLQFPYYTFMHLYLLY